MMKVDARKKAVEKGRGKAGEGAEGRGRNAVQ